MQSRSIKIFFLARAKTSLERMKTRGKVSRAILFLLWLRITNDKCVYLESYETMCSIKSISYLGKKMLYWKTDKEEKPELLVKNPQYDLCYKLSKFIFITFIEFLFSYFWNFTLYAENEFNLLKKIDKNFSSVLNKNIYNFLLENCIFKWKEKKISQYNYVD